VNEREMVKELTDYFASSYGDKLILELTRTCGNIPEEDRPRICEIIREDNAPNFKVGIKAIADACRKLGTPFHKSTDLYVPAVDWTCDACGLSFKYAQTASYDDKHDRGIFDYCPRCGFQPCDTIQGQAEARQQRGKFREWYEVRKERFLTDWRNRGYWSFDKKKDDEFAAQQRREEIEAMKQYARDEVARVAGKVSA
jgi:hypothetical protein